MVRLPDSYGEYYLKNWKQLSEKERRRILNRRNKDRAKQKRKDFLASHPSCAYCERPFSETLKATIDHVIPISMGGGGSYSNLVACCADCNNLKSNLTLGQFRQVIWQIMKIMEGNHPMTITNLKTIWDNIYGPECKFEKYVDSEQARFGR